MVNAKRCARAFAVLLVLTIAFVEISDAVDRSKFKDCDKTHFCKRNRSNGRDDRSEQEKGRYKLATSSLSINRDAASITGELKDTIWVLRDPLSVSVQLMKGNVLRVKINEKNPLHPRYEVRDVLMPEAIVPGHAQISQKNTDPSRPYVSFTYGAAGEFEARVYTEPSPFIIELVEGGKVTMRTNGLGLLNFEQYRQPNPRPEGVEAAADPAAVKFDYDVDGMWEERFSSHTDHKPRGPAAVAMDISFVGYEHVYGIPEHATDLSLPTTVGDGAKYHNPYRLYNLDVFEYELDETMALYGAIPFMMAHNAERTNGMLWLNSAETYIDVFLGREADGTPRKDTHWISESGIIDLFIFPGPKPADVFAQYAALTGFTPLPQQFALAYHQCRWNYKSEDDVLQVDAGFDEHDIPMDVMWLDIEHTDGKKYFTWDNAHFPHPKDMQDKLALKSRKMVTIIDPHIKRTSGYSVHSEAERRGFYIKTKDKSDYEGWCWPGSVSYLDFTQSSIRDYWADLFALDQYQGSTSNLYTWNDMNEPSVFNGPEVTMHKDNLHGSNWDIEHRDVHNMYGFYHHWATAQGLTQRDNARPFVLTRSFFAGSQRFGAMWTGDNKAEWSHLQVAQPMLLAMNIAGFSFSGADVGGFFGNPDAELVTRWNQAAAYQPFFRGHAHIDTKRREPWVFGEPYTAMIREAIRSRYRILPYVYTVFHESSVKGLPVMRPLWAEFPTDSAVFAMHDQFLLGSALMVKPVVSSGVTQTTVYLPGAEPWYDFKTYRAFTGPGPVTVKSPLEKIPVYQRGGSIVVRRDRARRSSSLMVHDPFTLVVALDSNKAAQGALYLDDGRSFDYKNGAFLHRTFNFSNMRLSSSRSGGNGKLYKNGCVVERILILGLADVKAAALTYSGSAAKQSLMVETLSEDGAQYLEIRKPWAPIDDDWVITLH